MLNRGDILAKSRVFTLDEMRAYLESAAGRTLTTAQLDKLLRDTLPKESYFQSAILRWLKETYPAAFVWKVQTGPYARQGVPDICAIIDGRFYGFEVKRPFVGRLSRIQQTTMESIEKAGGNLRFFLDATKPFSNWAALWCLNHCLQYFPLELKTFPDHFMYQESAYFQAYCKRVRYSKWQAAKDAFVQSLDPESPAFDQYRLNLWGAARCPEDVQVTYSYDGSATSLAAITFITVGGPAEKIVRKWSEQFPDLEITHEWKPASRPQDSGCVIYHRQAVCA